MKDLLTLWQQGLCTSTQKANLSMLAKIEAYTRYDVSIKNIDPGSCIGFVHIHVQSIQVNSARTYLHKFYALLHNAARQRYIQYTPLPPIAGIIPKYKAPEREYLDKKEIQKLEKDRSPHSTTKRAFLFSCHTGLRISDIETLTQGDIYRQGAKYIISKMQVKTGNEMRIPIDFAAEKIFDTVRLIGRFCQIRSCGKIERTIRLSPMS